MSGVRPCHVCGKAFTGDDYAHCRVMTVFPGFVMHVACEDAFWNSKGTMFDLTLIDGKIMEECLEEMEAKR